MRIITLSPHLAELVYLLGAGDRLLGVVEYSDFPEQVKKIQRVGGANGLDIERILLLRPDLILAWQGGTRESDIQHLKELGLRVVSIKSESLEDIPGSINILGKLLDKPKQSAKLVARFNEQRKEISDKYQDKPALRYFIEISRQPLMVLTNRHSFGAGLKLCNLENIFADEDRAAIVVDLESILVRKPDVVLLKGSVTENVAEIADRQAFYRLDKGTGHSASVIGFNEDAAFRQTPRLLEAIGQVCEKTRAQR